AGAGEAVAERSQRPAGKELLPRERAREREAALARKGETDVREQQGPRLAVRGRECRVPDDSPQADILSRGAGVDPLVLEVFGRDQDIPAAAGKAHAPGGVEPILRAIAL